MTFPLRSLLPFILVLLSCCVFAIEIERFELLNTGDGLSQNSVQSIFCDSRGYMWFGTMDGLNQYDGYEFKIYKANDSDPYTLTNNRIISIWEDQHGFIWVETHDGHYHYLDLETERFYSFPEASDPEIPQNTRVSCFLETENEIWLGTDHAGIYRLSFDHMHDPVYRPQRVKAGVLNGLTHNAIHFIVADKGNGVWAGTEKGLNYIKSDSSEPSIKRFSEELSFVCGTSDGKTLYAGTRSEGIFKFNREQSHPEKLPDSQGSVTAMHLSKDRRLLAGIRESGLIVYDPATGVRRQFLGEQTIEEIVEDRKGNFWISTSSFGINRISQTLDQIDFYELVPKAVQPLVDLQRQSVFEDRDSNLWIATHGGGLGLFDEKSRSFRFFRNNPNDPNSLSSDIAYCVAQDRSGLIWVGTGQLNGGVNKLIPANPLFVRLIAEPSVTRLTDNMIRAVMQDRQSRIWLATKSGFLYVYDDSLRLQKKFTGIPAEQEYKMLFNVYAILEDRNGFLWLGSKGGGLARSLQPVQNYSSVHEIRFQIFRHQTDNPASLSNNNVYSIIQDQNGSVWIGTYGGGIDVIAAPYAPAPVFRHLTSKNSQLSSDQVRCIAEDSAGRIWAATTYGLNLLVREGEKISIRSFLSRYSDPRSLSYNDVVHIFEDSSRNLWFGTFGGGLNLLEHLTPDRAAFKRIGQPEGLISDVVFGILEDQFENLWLSTENGISKYDPAEARFNNYSLINGLPCSHFSENTCLRLNDGRLVFGSLNGALIVTGKAAIPDHYAPPVVFTRFLIFNQDVSFREKRAPLKKHINYTDHIILPFDQAGFGFEYAALSFFDPERNSYAYMLEGFDQDWYHVRHERRASYTNVPPGEYIFNVKAAGWNGTWSDRPRSIRITILPPWWRTGWAYTAYVIFLALVAKITGSVVAKYNRMRTDLLVERKVNEIKLKFFTNISHEIRTPLTLILGPLEDLKRMKDLPPSVQELIGTMSGNGRRMLQLINQLLDFRKMKNRKMKLKIQEVEVFPFVREICVNFEQMALHRKIHFHYPLRDQKMSLYFDRERIDSVIFNLLSNAFKFTPAGKNISVEIETEEKKVSISVADEGKGIEADQLPLLFERYTPLSDIPGNLPGTGIGLAYSLELARLHHGDLVVQSVQGRGSRFRLILLTGKEHFSPDELVEPPAELLNRTEALRAEDPVPEDIPGAGTADKVAYRVLLVEDQLEIRHYVTSFLSRKYGVLHAENGEEGLKMAREKQPDLIITDLMMPVMDGLEMTRIIKDDFSISHIPVVMLTARSAVDDQMEGIGSGAEAYVVKPFHSEYLMRIVENLIRQRQNVLAHFEKSNPLKGELKITDKDEEFLKQVVALIEHNSGDPDFNVDTLVKEAGFGRTVFYHKIKTLTGMSPVEFLRNMKLQIATRYLEHGGYGVSEAAYLSGFNDLKYFTKKFKERYGCVPSKFSRKS